MDERATLLKSLTELVTSTYATKKEVAVSMAQLVREVKKQDTAGIVSKAIAAFLASKQFSTLQSLVKDLGSTVVALAPRVERIDQEAKKHEAALDKRITSLEGKNLDSRVTALEEEERADPVEPETPESIKAKLGQLTMEDVQGLIDRLEQVEKTASKAHGTVIAYSRGAIKLYDLSDQLDGVTKTFALPTFWRVISVQSSSTPNAFRPTTDYTTDAAAATITFTSEIDAGSTLSAGQTLTLIYAEP